MKTQLKKVLVTGASGKQGGAVAHAFLKKGYPVRSFSRKEGPATLELRSLGAEIAIGSFDDPSSVERAATGVESAFVMTTPYEKGTEAEVHQGIAVIDALKRAGIKHLLFTSVAGADKMTGIPHFDSKTRIEEYLRASGIPFTIIAPVFFMENYTSPWWLPGLQAGKLAMALPPDRKLQHIAVADIGRFAAHIIEHPARFIGQRIEIASDEPSGSRVAQILSDVTGRTITYVETPLEQVRATNEDFAKMYEWFNRVGYSVNIRKLRSAYHVVGWHTFEKWAKKQDWSSLLHPALA
ncbi:MAG: NmrA/HSCARG family protein [Elusimicrobia bacterium]|nr:NmrA/HSCARG family protein [Candidatus Obscuribacterium magneticum]MCB4755474.1 NmrA/HSCARG family protein [Candidatus Obscuribacterium magneticum]